VKAAPLTLELPMPPYGVAAVSSGVGAGGWLRRVARLAVRVPGLIAIALAALLDLGFRCAAKGDKLSPREASLWLSRWSKLMLSWLKVRVTAHGAPPKRGMLVSNHSSYLDIPILASVHPMIFVANADAREWAMFGWLARLAGSLLAQRGRRLRVARLSFDLIPLVVRGNVVAWFPGKATSGRSEVTRFRSSLLAPAGARGWPVTPTCIRYASADPAPEGDRHYRDHQASLCQVLHLLTQKEVRATVVFGRRLTATTNRQGLARELRARVAGLFRSCEGSGVAGGLDYAARAVASDGSLSQ
jgi:1-acyl-sn-glycerol-3-phosphate acyltransferase